MSAEQGKKRLLSPGNVNLVNTPDDKRRRNDSLVIEEDEPAQPLNMEPEQQPSLLDLKKSIDAIITSLNLTASKEDIKNLASKNDIKTLDDRLLAHDQEIGQLRDEIKTLKGNIDSLQSNVDSQLAASLASGSGSVGRDPGSITFNMASTDVNNRCVSPPQRRNLVIEGLTGDSDQEIVSQFINLSSAVGVTVYAREVEQVVRISRRDESNKKPGPVLITLTRIVLRDTILKKKGNLNNTSGYDGVYVNADEPFEVRKAKSFLRKAAYHAKKQGEIVVFKHNQVSINGVEYTTDNYDKIPAKYLDPSGVVDQDEAHKPMEASGGEPLSTAKDGLVRKGERMRVTRKGLCFSGPSCYLSNMAYIPIKFNNRTFESNEQGFQWTKAIDHQDPDLASEIKKTDNSYEVKNAGGLITASSEWKRCAPNLLEKMFEAKLDQHPELLDRLIETYPLDIIEASIDTTYGGGGPLFI